MEGKVIQEEVRLGKSELFMPALGVGTMAWSGSRFWGYGDRLSADAMRGAFEVSLAAGLRLFDTAEIYGGGRSERALGELLASQPPGTRRVIVATKYAPFPWRIGRRSVVRALRRSLTRLRLPHVDLYQIHFPGNPPSIRVMVDGLAEAVESGLARTVGVSNFRADQMRRAYEQLARRRIPLVSNQVEYSLIQRSAEVDGVYDACRELGITLIAYSPLGRGVLSGKYRPESSARDTMRRVFPQFREDHLRSLSPLLAELAEVGRAHGGCTPAQVALNWLTRREGVIAIPGAKNAEQAAQNAAALELRIDDDEADRLESLTRAFRRPKKGRF